MRCLAIVIAATLGLVACGGNTYKPDAGDILLNPSSAPDVDKRLLTPCSEFKTQLVEGTEEEVVIFTKSLLSARSACAKEKQAWIDWFYKTFPKETK